MDRNQGRSKAMSNGNDADVDLLQEDVKPPPKRWKKIQSALLPAVVLGVIIGLVIMLFIINNQPAYKKLNRCAQDQCRLVLVESIPENLTYSDGSPSHLSIFSAWKELIGLAEESINISALYWTLRKDDVQPSDPSSWQGEKIFQAILSAGKDRGIAVKIAQDLPSEEQPMTDSKILADKGAAEVRSLNFTHLVGAGVLHTKFIIVDMKHFYIGSANMDWRSLTQVKELGVVVYNCSCMADDLSKIFQVYWDMGEVNATVPPQWPRSYDAKYNASRPYQLQTIENNSAELYLSSSPPEFCPPSRTGDIDAIVKVIRDAKEFIYIAVMDYFPTTLYSHPRKFWPIIDDELRKAAFDRFIKVRLLASWWNHSKHDLPNYLMSLQTFNFNIDTKLFIVPSFTKQQSEIPFARVNHNKYMVTDTVAYIGTSNWSGDYFISTGGVGFVLNETSSNYNRTHSEVHTIRKQLQDVFERDWNSEYAHNISDVKLPDTVAHG